MMSAKSLMLGAGRRPLLPLTWPELVRHYLEGHQLSPPFVEAREALDALKQGDYCALSGAYRLKLLEALIHAAADTEIVRRCALELSSGAGESLPAGV